MPPPYEPPESAPPLALHEDELPDLSPADSPYALEFAQYVTAHRNGGLRAMAAAETRSNASKDKFDKDVEDVLQDGLERAWKYLPGVDPAKCKLSAYIFCCIRRAAKDRYRHAEYRSENQQIPFSHLSAGNTFSEPWTDADNPCRLTAEAEEKKLLEKAISLLPEKISEVATLLFIDRLTKTAISKRLGISRPTIDRYVAAAAQFATDLINPKP